jgi:hypothetical protein
MLITSFLKTFWKFLFVALLVSGCSAMNRLAPTATIVEVKETTTLVQRTSTNTPIPVLLSSPTSTSIPPMITPVPNTETPVPVTETFEDEWESPNRLWVANKRTIFQREEIRVILVVRSDWGGVEWVVEDSLHPDTPGIGYPYPVPFYWSRNGRFMYFTHQSSGDGCFGAGKFRGSDLSRLDLSNGEVLLLFPNFSSWMSISPDEQYLAYFVYTKQGITLRELSSGNEEILDMLVQQEDVDHILDQSHIIWSPDGKSLLYSVLAGACDPPPYSTWIIRVDMNNRTQKIILENDPRGFIPISWVTSNQVLAHDNNGMIWWLDPRTGEIQDTQ